MASKILVVGAIKGRFAEVIPKLTALHAKQSFAFAVLTGDVLSSEAPDDLLNGELRFPLPTYFTLGTSPLPSAVINRIDNNAGEVVENLFYLGKRGSIKTSEGIRIVAVGGSYDPNLTVSAEKAEETKHLPFYTTTEINSLKGVNQADILISNEFPLGFGKGSANAPKDITGSKPLADLVRHLRPRYHFTSSESYYEREPYINDVRKDEASVITSRFYSLAPWGNAEKQKAVFAFSLDPSQPTTVATNATACPYEDPRPHGNRKRPAEGSSEGTFFWGDHTSGHGGEGRGNRRRKHNAPRPPPGPDACFFCLSYPALEKHLIVSIGNEAYLTTAKGPLTSATTNPKTLPFSSHIIIIPFSHTPTLNGIEDGETRNNTRSEMVKYKQAVEKMLKARGCGAVTFEIRRANGVHAHWQVVPVREELMHVVDDAFEKLAKESTGRGFEDVEASSEEGAEEEAHGGDAFTYWTSDREGGKELRLGGDEYFDLQFGRRALANVLGTGRERGNWRDCVMPIEEESKDAKEFKEAFKEFDFSLEE
ncbi:CwfJ C-terminus 1-domain-containing protein-like protein [Pyronema domesticum]|uniref:Similar to CWF19-like protein 1 homolog acc. no. O16216 n=1 Tax=Pyronema omphalodes (strain CBS 100304) TaxID=1076935 RepID=U4LR08_PYROM|nr:CwfJ C-terminus 1-domain-containing protein-like protein [Pyronema domesticum]CCX34365.1 Similar to CWF19-like protein 1 homolog; acc. no. O16216 [Pyronema omphalodes CBS 100304]